MELYLRKPNICGKHLCDQTASLITSRIFGSFSWSMCALTLRHSYSSTHASQRYPVPDVSTPLLGQTCSLFLTANLYSLDHLLISISVKWPKNSSRSTITWLTRPNVTGTSSTGLSVRITPSALRRGCIRSTYVGRYVCTLLFRWERGSRRIQKWRVGNVAEACQELRTRFAKPAARRSPPHRVV